MKTFKDKVAAITGAGSGMGRTLAVELARRGCHVALSDVNEAGLLQTAAQAREAGVQVSTRVVNVADRDAVLDWADAVVAEHGRVNLIFNNAGVALAAPVETVRIEDFQWLMNINFWGVVHGTQAFLPHLRASGDGHVINTSSLFGLLAMPTQGTYNASKFAVRGFTEALRIELEVEGAPVSATCIHPGGIATGINQSGRVDGSVERLMGVNPQRHRQLAEKMIQTTSAHSAALQILRGVERNARRVLVGPDARFFDVLVRLLGAHYQALVVRRARRMAMVARSRSAVAAEAT